MGAKLSGEERRLLICKLPTTKTFKKLTFLGATEVISNVFNEMPDLVDFSNQKFPPDPKQ
jgi:hypothetical protein